MVTIPSMMTDKAMVAITMASMDCPTKGLNGKRSIAKPSKLHNTRLSKIDIHNGKPN